ncbi:hypothetical protein GOODEAATRI_017896, partial [Goodea atripinnis]
MTSGSDLSDLDLNQNTLISSGHVLELKAEITEHCRVTKLLSWTGSDTFPSWTTWYQMACRTPEQKVALVCEQGVHLQTLLTEAAEEGRATHKDAGRRTSWGWRHSRPNLSFTIIDCSLSLWSSQKFKTIQTDNIDAKRECLRQALSVYLNEDPEKVVKERM